MKSIANMFKSNDSNNYLGDKESQNNKVTQELGENDIIQKCIGCLGRWHLWVCFIIFLVKFPVAFHQLNIVVLAPEIEFECENSDNPKCSTNCSQHMFDTSIFSNTITMQWDLVCENKYLESIAQTLTMLGILTGSFIFGFLSDRYGRKKPLVWAVILQFLAGLSTAFSPWFSLFLVLRFLASFATGGTMVTSFVLIMEIIGVKWRTKVGILYQIPFNLGHLIIPIISYFLRNWQYFQIAISVPSALFISYYWILPESPRWCLAVGKSKEAVDTMIQAAKFNKLPTDKIEYEVAEYLKQKNSDEIKEEKTGNILDLLRTSVIRKYTLVLWVNWLFCGLSFFGSSQYIGKLGGDIFLNIALSAVIQIPGVLLCCWTVEAWGRKTTLIVANVTCGVALIISGFVPDHPYWIKSALSCIGISCSMISFSTVYIYAGEIFPTIVRNVGLGSSSTFARVGSMVAPFIANLSSDKTWIPLSIFGITMLIGALLCNILPETLNCKLPESIEDVEELEMTRIGAKGYFNRDIIDNSKVRVDMKDF